MATRKSGKKAAKKKGAKKSAKKKSGGRAKSKAKAAPRKAAKKKAAKKTQAAKKKPARRAAPRPAAPSPKSRLGAITHTELASADPEATQRWCESVLGWKFGEAMPTPTGPYRMWQFPIGTGGGIRSSNPPEAPGSIPFCEVADIQGTFMKAIEAGATAMLPPEEIPGGMGSIAIVAAPGGVPMGFWAAAK